MYFQLVESQALSNQGQPDVFNLHRLTLMALLPASATYSVAPSDDSASPVGPSSLAATDPADPQLPTSDEGASAAHPDVGVQVDKSETRTLKGDVLSTG